MSDLLERIADLTRSAIESESKTANIYLELDKAYEELGNEKFEDVVGLNRPNVHVFILDIKNHTDILLNNKFAVKSRTDDEAEKERKILIEEWNEAIKKIPQRDEYTLEGIKTWHISSFGMVPDGTSVREPLFKEEMVKLIASGFRLAINDEFGTGSIHVKESGFTIVLWQYNHQKIIHKGTLDEVVDWLINFYEKQIV